MANDNGAKGTFIIFGDGNSSASIEKGDDGGWDFATDDEVKNNSKVIRRGVIRKKPRPKGFVVRPRKTPCRSWVRAANFPNDLGCGEDKGGRGVNRGGGCMTSSGWSGTWKRMDMGEWRDDRGR